MMVLIICGGRDGGFTSVMCRSFSDGLRTQGISSEIIFPLDMNIDHCDGCGYCSDDGTCYMTDDMNSIYDKFRSCDMIVLATPIHFSGPSSAIKTVIDRFQPLWFDNPGHPKYAAALLSGGSPSPYFINTLSIFKAFSITAGMKWIGHLEIPDTDNKDTTEVIGPAFDYGNDLGKLLKRDRILCI